MIDNERFELTEGDKINPLWIRISKHVNERIDTLRAQNDCDLTEAQTAKQRGRIAELKLFLSLGDEKILID